MERGSHADREADSLPTERLGDGPVDGPTINDRRTSPPEEPRELPAMLAAGDIVAARYRVERLVGSGGMAHVFAVRDGSSGKPLALKALDPSLLSDFDAHERFSREARAMATLTSEYTVRIHDVGELPNGLPYLVMDYLEGQDLARTLVKRAPLPFAQVCEWLEQACEAVGEAHDKGIIHRDLKPQNLFLVNDNTIRVLDFGIARSLGNTKLETLTKAGDVLGTLTYMAPEQIRSSKSVDFRADIWSLGGCLYRLVTGQRPFGGHEGAVIHAIVVGEPEPMMTYRPDTPSVIEAIVARCLRKSPDERYATVGDLRRALMTARTTILSGRASPSGERPAVSVPPRRLDQTSLLPSGPPPARTATTPPVTTMPPLSMPPHSMAPASLPGRPLTAPPISSSRAPTAPPISSGRGPTSAPSSLAPRSNVGRTVFIVITLLLAASAIVVLAIAWFLRHR